MSAGMAEEQAALRRVAVLVAQGAPPKKLFGAVAVEAGRLLDVEYSALCRYEADGTTKVVGGWARTLPGQPGALGLKVGSGGHNVHTMVRETGRPARIDDYGQATGDAAHASRDMGFRSAVGAPIYVQSRLWGIIIVVSTDPEPLPASTEERLADFSELVGTAVANAEAQRALTASRARIVSAADSARRRIERDLHDGAQQHLVSLILRFRNVRAGLPPEAVELADELNEMANGLSMVLEELRELARGIHPAALANGGLGAALKLLAGRSAVPVRLNVEVDGQLSEPIELGAYYAVAEALTNAVKHGQASVIDVAVSAGPERLTVSVRDDGVGGADATRGSGLVGLTDRIETLGGRLRLESPPGGGTVVEIELPLA